MNQPYILRVGSVSIEPCTVLAPMEGLTDASFRALVRRMGGCGLVVTEFVSAQELSLQTARALKAACIASDAHPVAIQIYGRDPARLAESARFCQGLGADLVDINMGCPSRAVTRHQAGVALMREPALATRIVQAVRAAIGIPLTVKMRLGWDHGSRNAVMLARIFEAEGVDGLTVHGRTREQLYTGQADWAAIGEVKRAVNIPVVGNGDVCSPEDALELRRVAGVDGIMVGRAALRNPWLLLQISQVLQGLPPMEPSLEERRQALLEHFALVCAQVDRPAAALGRLKKVAGYFTTGLPGAAELRHAVLHVDSVPLALAAVNRYFDQVSAG